MKLKGRGILVTLLLLFGLYAYYDYRQDQNAEMKRLSDSKLLTVNYDQIDHITIENKSGKIVLQRTVDGWNLEEPVKDQADNQAVEGFVNQFMTDKILEVARDHGPVDPTDYGLDKPAGTITLKTTSGAQDVFVVSEKKNFEENPFITRNDEERVLVVDPTVLKKALQTATDFRDRRFLRGRLASLDQLKLKNQKGLLEISQKEGKWILTGKPEIALDQNKVREFLQTIGDAKGASFLDQKEVPAGKSLFTLELLLQDRKWKADVIQAKDMAIYAKISDPAIAMKMEAGAVDRLISATAEDFKDLPQLEKKTEEKDN